jgi:phosphoglycolate phosphatase-like HAD superfamily hydrolase
LRELWIASSGLFLALAERHRLAVFTGRLRWEANLTLGRFLPGVFDPVIGADDVTRHKPDPEGLHRICQTVAHGRCWYVGDTVDDARASRAANIPFIGIAAAANPRREELIRLLREEGAIAVLEDINALEDAIAQNR